MLAGTGGCTFLLLGGGVQNLFGGGWKNIGGGAQPTEIMRQQPTNDFLSVCFLLVKLS